MNNQSIDSLLICIKVCNIQGRSCRVIDVEINWNLFFLISCYSGTWTHFLFFPFLNLIFHKAIFLFLKLWLNISVTLMDLYFSFLVYFSHKKQFKSTVWSKIVLLSLCSSTLKSTLSLCLFFKNVYVT